MSLDQKTLKEALNYDPLTGIFVWIKIHPKCRTVKEGERGMKITCPQCDGFGYTSWMPYIECKCQHGRINIPFYHLAVLRVYQHFKKIIEQYEG